jgi:hypothetical protein
MSVIPISTPQCVRTNGGPGRLLSHGSCACQRDAVIQPQNTGVMLIISFGSGPTRAQRSGGPPIRNTVGVKRGAPLEQRSCLERSAGQRSVSSKPPMNCRRSSTEKARCDQQVLEPTRDKQAPRLLHTKKQLQQYLLKDRSASGSRRTCLSNDAQY